MIQITKIFRFEMAHAIYGYPGPCKDIHGHSYELHVSVSGNEEDNDFIQAPGILIDFKDLKRIVNESIVKKLDHKVVLSQDFLKAHEHMRSMENLEIWNVEPTAENMLLTFAKALPDLFPPNVRLEELRLYETADSYARWIRK
jgi:6-pyruvoyltetrahydropterin/6-carboxytetrahydropterin synthase